MEIYTPMTMTRPPLPDDQRRKLRQVRMTDAEWELIQQVASETGKTASDITRDGAIKEAKRLRKAAGQPKPDGQPDA